MKHVVRLWALQQAAKQCGITPHALATKEFLISLECEGLVAKSNNYPFWRITERGQEELKKLMAQRT